MTVSSECPWLKSYPSWIPHQINPDRYQNIAEMFEQSCSRFKDLPSFTNMGVSIGYCELDELSKRFADFLTRRLGMKPGDRIGIQMPNVLQYPVALFGAIRAGIIVVNTNPLYTEREMSHQYRDSGAKAVVILANFADKLERILKDTKIEHVIISEMGDLFPIPKRWIVNTVVKHVKKMVPSYHLKHVTFREALEEGSAQHFQKPKIEPGDIAFLQYTGGTTGVSKGAMLTHRNVLANMEQIAAWITSKLEPGKEVIMTPLPLYHIFSLSVNCLAFGQIGANLVLVTNPRDIPAFIKEIEKSRPTAMSVVNTLVSAMLHCPELPKVDLSGLKITVAGGMALQTAIAKQWMEVTKTRIIEGYGLTETSPVASVNPIDGGKLGTIGLPVPSTLMKVIGEDGQELGFDEPGELCVFGPQVMKGYWNQPQETDNVLGQDGWLRTGDIAQVDKDGYFKIVDRKKDMILVSGFNVYPNEVEDVAVQSAKVKEAAAVGIPCEHSGEIVKLFVVKKDPSLTAQEMIEFCQRSLTSYKVPKQVEFIAELPKNNVGKILRRELRNKL